MTCGDLPQNWHKSLAIRDLWQIPLRIASEQAEISALCQPKYQVPERPFGFIPNAGNNLRAKPHSRQKERRVLDS